MTLPTIVNIYKEPSTLYIGRGSKWGNPFRISTLCDRSQSIHRHKIWILQHSELIVHLPELFGHTLGCFCKPKACHGDTLRELCEKLYSGGDFLNEVYTRLRDETESNWPEDWKLCKTVHPEEVTKIT